MPAPPASPDLGLDGHEDERRTDRSGGRRRRPAVRHHAPTISAPAVKYTLRIESLDILAGEVYPLNRLSEALEWASANRTLLRAKWEELAENETTKD